MPLTGSVIETGVDKLVNLINLQGKISSSDAAKELGVSTTVVMEWADFLEEEGIIKIEYKFTKPFLVARKLAKKDVQEKAKEFSGKKEVFVRKAEISLSFLERESDKLKSLKDEFDRIKKELGFDISSVKKELEELKNYEQLKLNLDKKIEDQKTDSMKKLQQITEQILREKEKYNSFITQVREEEKLLEHDRIEANSLEESEKLVHQKLEDARNLIQRIEAKTKIEEQDIATVHDHMQKLAVIAKAAELKIEKERSLIEPLVKQSQIQTEKIKDLQDEVISKIGTKEKNLAKAKKASIQMKQFFKKKMGVLGLIEKANKDRNDLERELIALIRKAKSFQLSSKSRDVGNEIMGLEKKFKDVDNKKKVFENELKKIGVFFK
jgi:chromosome segregation ATPase